MLETFNYNNEKHKELFFKLVKDSQINKYLGKGQFIDLIKVPIVKKYVLTISDIPVGIGFIMPLKENEAEIRYCIAEEYRGHKYSSVLVNNLLEKIDNNTVVYADIQLDNNASAKAVINNGFETEDNFVYHTQKR